MQKILEPLVQTCFLCVLKIHPALPDAPQNAKVGAQSHPYQRLASEKSGVWRRLFVLLKPGLGDPDPTKPQKY